VFDTGADGVPVVARQEDCQTCYLCEVYCPVDALFVAPQTDPVPPESPLRDEEHVARAGLLGSYRERIGWGGGRIAGARLAVGPPIEAPPGCDSGAGLRRREPGPGKVPSSLVAPLLSPDGTGPG
jgi:ferredoxin